MDEKELAALYEREKDTQRSENTYHLRYMMIDSKSGVRDDQAYMELLKSKDMPAYGRAKGLEVVDLGTKSESDLTGPCAALLDLVVRLPRPADAGGVGARLVDVAPAAPTRGKVDPASVAVGMERGA